MGITIHYYLKFEGTEEEVLQKLNQVNFLSEGLGFKETSEVFRLDYSKELEKGIIDDTYSWAYIQYKPYWHLPHMTVNKDTSKYKGWVCSCWYGDGCEPTNIGLIRKEDENIWIGNAFTKTQYANDFEKAHMTVCTLLKGIEYLGILEKVSDEYDYWEGLRKLPPDKGYKDKRQKKLLDKLDNLISEIPIPGLKNRGFFMD